MADGKHMESAKSLEPLSPFDEGSAIASPKEKFEVLTHQRHINCKLEQLLKAIRNGDNATLEEHAVEIRTSFARVEQYLSFTIQPKYYGQHRPHDTQVAEKVFAISGLLESILENVRVLDLMRCYRVNRTFRNAIEQSQKLQTCLFLRSDLSQLKPRFPLYTKYIGPFGTAKVAIQTRVGLTYPLGARWKRMLLR